LYSERVRESLASELMETLRRYHDEHPLEAGAPQQWLRSRVAAPESAIDAVLASMASSGIAEVEQGTVRVRGFAASLDARQRPTADAVARRLAQAGAEPPSIEELATELDQSTDEISSIVRWLARDGSLVPVEPNRYYVRSAVEDLITSLRCGMSHDEDYGPADLRSLIGLTRKFLIPFLEYCDREGYTIRDGLGRRRAGTRMAK
jgi:selenocysteine-specific elongation factor